MIELAATIFAVFRLALLLTEEEGPFELAARWRSLFPDDNWIGRGVRCPLCVSFWLALIPALWLFDPWPLYWLGIAGAVAALVEYRP